MSDVLPFFSSWRAQPRSMSAVLLLLQAASAATADDSTPARHEATFTTFCDTGSVEAGDCWCKGGGATAAIGDGSWLWHELVGKRCPAQANDRCDCTQCGGNANDCPHEGCWQCEGVNAPDCNADDALKRCEVEVHGTHGAEKFYITEVCPGAHPCNRCKEPKLQRCAAWSPLAIDLCGTTWHNVFEKSRSEAMGYVTLSCYPHSYAGGKDGPGEEEQLVEEEEALCYSTMAGDAKAPGCEDWCDPAFAKDHCKWCKCRGCDALAGACAAVLEEVFAAERKRAQLFQSCGQNLDCESPGPEQSMHSPPLHHLPSHYDPHAPCVCAVGKSWCNIGNCAQCPCAQCERCGAAPPTHLPAAKLQPPKAVDAAPANAAAAQPAACHGWCIAGAEPEEDPEIVCQSSKCAACPFCRGRKG